MQFQQMNVFQRFAELLSDHASDVSEVSLDMQAEHVDTVQKLLNMNENDIKLGFGILSLLSQLGKPAIAHEAELIGKMLQNEINSFTMRRDLKEDYRTFMKNGVPKVRKECDHKKETKTKPKKIRS